MRPFELSLAAAADAIQARELSPVDLVDSVLDRIEQVEPHLDAYVTVTADQARRAAREAEDAIATGHPHGPLHGVPMGLKDLIDVAGVATTASSLVRADHRAEADSAVAARLRAAGAVLVGKTHTHEFAYGLTTPQTSNAWDRGRVAGGSSGGSAVAVASGAATFALGTDSGGSIRVPAALNGVVGLKPTYGLVPRHGVTSLSWSLDHVGPITRTVEDAALVLSVLAGHDPRDPASLPAPVGDYRPGRDTELAGLRVGVPRNYYFEHVDPEVEAAVRRAIDRLADLGARLVEVEIPMTRYVQATQWALMAPEASAYHERTLRTIPDRYQADVRILLEAAELVPAGDYLRAQRARTLMRQEWARMLDEVDVIAAPTVPATAVPADQETVTWPDGTVEGVADLYVRLSAPANITGVPSLSVPVGHDSAGLPIGMQLLGRPFGEATILRVGHAYELTEPARALAPVV
ncbi:aspartyl-tRNA(Asn)/glutamyl-tRNA(Gln) amidotransferase subunit A [Streptoalloteichus tenebrarius]|uniref:Aspartyl-tRNA(Asn)/glutamyl-tRNA(Gln) amidotransferase subunit A n=1 Tax=Streptoalloteichus tenebrarius (strain ATCC 17920 / DSM 40477 / JCM 4838 / CBS 697.72 / NBRC 16177 / NCIMB 11028 / NRRL B-12390 / A12253. 1 / ISP 5477) TaxID=1933 RepID=A0ABT1HZP3_STRSD|nr:amidase [Streptoalloteichus tenebrarius]MCP2260998.1 aspartyl-tRNA(Asn)/glutamyl-tRNA(Gln) amidotransferase subunit A [Streptoalloteichus tenebrarius]BFE98937.1 amidase [Streptoalloteichus tenebrarius]